MLGEVSQESDKVISKSNGKQTGPYLVLCVSIIFINFSLIKKIKTSVSANFSAIKRAHELWTGNMSIYLFRIHAESYVLTHPI